MRTKIVIITIFLILIFSSISTSGMNIENEKNIENTKFNTNDNPDYEINVGHVEIVWNSNSGKYDYSFSYEDPLEDVIFNWQENNWGEKIRLKITWKIKENDNLVDLDEEQWYFEIVRINFENHNEYILPEGDDEYKVTITDTLGSTDEKQGTIYMDFTPHQDYFLNAWHTIRIYNNDIDDSIDGIKIQLDMKYKKKIWGIPGDWDVTSKTDFNYLNWRCEYKNDVPTLVECPYTTDNGKIKLTLKVEDADWNRDTSSRSYGIGDPIGVIINWGDGTETNSGFWDEKWPVYEGSVEFTQSHEYKPGEYTLNVQVKDWYNTDYHDISNTINIREVKVSKAKAKISFEGIISNILKIIENYEELVN